jgi:ribonucleoside-diphosphate reductase alpha chain
MSQLLVDSGVPFEVDVYAPANVVFSFPMKAPEGTVSEHNLTAIEHLRLYLAYANNWVEHAVSITVSVREHEWISVGGFVFEHFDELAGVSFLPAGDGHIYQQAPYEEITEEEYLALVAASPEIRFADLAFYETTDGTKGSQTLACSSDTGCEDVNI